MLAGMVANDPSHGLPSDQDYLAQSPKAMDPAAAFQRRPGVAQGFCGRCPDAAFG